jgi:hypothetical protein
MKYLIIPVVIFLFVSLINGQDRKLVQLSGRIIDEQTEPLPFAHVLIMNNYRGTITDREGKFSLVVEVFDTVLFSTLGYKRRTMVIPDTLARPFITADIVLQEDTILIAEVEVYPWRSYEEFKEALLNLRLPDGDNERARRNIALIKTQIILYNEPNARENFQYVMEQQYRETFNQGMYPSYQIFNPFAWAKFFQALKRGDFKSDKK